MLPFIFPEWSAVLAAQSHYCGYYDLLEDGDINDDDIVDLKDAVLSLQITTGIYELPPICIYADINDDARIGTEETVYILRKISFE
ncbi:hypothetical protein DENIS_4039 [Desulfonema ishimotonii]|uniref:Dockerin domain-containing protein n=1 Tax=Desulfonema ishimotonii TaxID=45657 RepID=A0A401G1F4_9BACT|nr:hypothetical protein [Desulfonema ishimotonii]GBC63050.1 hypothetical protein DENIS_4039 [Desulfonema ishimotonii]